MVKGRFSNFSVHEIAGYIGNVHIIEYDEGLLLIDSGCINDVKRIERYVRQVIKRPLTDIKLIILTHLHPDHSGGAVKLRNKYKIPIAAHEDLDKWYAGFGGLLQHKIDCYLATTVAYRNKRKLERILYKRKIKPDFLLNDQELLPFLPDWQVLHVPGHTLYDLVIYHAKEGILFINDLICEVKGKPQLPIPILFPQEMAESFDRLLNTHATAIFRTHGGPIISTNAYEVFTTMQEILAKPLSPLARRIYRISIFPHQVRKKLKTK